MSRRCHTRLNFDAAAVPGSSKPWPQDCPWPAPTDWSMDWEVDFIPSEVDDEIDDLLAIKEYYDELVASGRLKEDYTLDDSYDSEWESNESDFDDEDDEFYPEYGEEYWDDGFCMEQWEEDLSAHMNLLKIDMPLSLEQDPVNSICRAIGYSFVNENLLRQAFTRRAFAVEYGLLGAQRKGDSKRSSNYGCSEELEFMGDSILNMVVTKELMDTFSHTEVENYKAPFLSKYDEGELSKLRESFIGKEHLSEQAIKLGLDRWILYGTGETASESSREDMMEALIGAVAIDSNWDMPTLEKVVDRMICLQIDASDSILKKSYYELFNGWHQKRFGCMPEYNIYHTVNGRYDCALKYQIPENGLGIWTGQIVQAEGYKRSEARELAAEKAFLFVKQNGLWLDWKNTGIVPDQDSAINQLQELYQKKYLEEPPVYKFEEDWSGSWLCECVCCGIYGYGNASSKTKAKKAAAYMVLTRLLDAGAATTEVPFT